MPEIAPDRLDGDDTDGIRRSLEEHGFACVRCARLPTPPPTHHSQLPPRRRPWLTTARREALSPAELEHAESLLWQHLEGDESPRMNQRRPIGWKRGQPQTWLEGHVSPQCPSLPLGMWVGIMKQPIW